MFKFYRSVLTAGIVTLGLAACGDDVTITDPPPPPPAGVTSVSVAPSTATISVNQEVVFASSVIADAGVSTAVTWTSSNPAIATVDGTGKVRGITIGTTTIVATSSADNGKKGLATVIVQANPPGVTSFTVAPSTLTLAPGATFQASANATFAPGQAAVAPVWSSSNASVATVNPTTGVITAVTPGSATITASLTVGGQTVTGNVGVTVRPFIGAQISIQSITTGLLNIPVTLNNVLGQIEVNLNVDPGELLADSVVVYLDGVAAARQNFAANPAPGGITLSINTASYTINTTAGTATASFFNGPRQVRAILYSRGGVTTATQGTVIVLNNQSGLAAQITRPTRSMIAVPFSSAVGQTFWGGPDVAGLTTVTVYPIAYEAGRFVTSLTFGLGGCPTTAVLTAAPFRATFGYPAAGATVNCTGYEWTGGPRDNVIVTAAIDNGSNGFPLSPLIPNVIVFGSTPDSLRLDYKGPTAVSAPLIVGSEGFNWVNDAFTLRPVAPVVTDFGVGGNATTYSIFVGSSAGVLTTFGTLFVNVAALAETNTNCAAPTVGCDGYAARATATDLLINPANSAVSATFGVDRTAPSIRYSATAAPSSFASIYTAGGTTAVLDSTTRAAYVGVYGADAGAAATGNIIDYIAAAAGTNDSVRTESIDNRSGLSRSIVTSRRFAQGGATGATANTGCQTSAGVFGAALIDGWRPAPAVHVTCIAAAVSGYYTTTETTVDRAGNLSLTYKRTLALDLGQPQVTGVSPNAVYTANTAAGFTIGMQDDLEVIDARLRVRYANVSQGDAGFTASSGLIWNFPGFTPFATRFDASIINPFLGVLTLDMFTVSIQETCLGAASPFAACLYRGDPIDNASSTVVQPDSVAVIVRDVFGSFVNNFVSGPLFGVSNELASPILSATVPAVGFYSVTYNASTSCQAGGILGGPCVIAGINFRDFAATASTRTYRATEAFSTTLPVFTRVDLFGLNAVGQWVYIQRIIVPAVVPVSGTIAAGAGTITGSDNGLERFWDYQFTSVPTGFTQYRALGVNGSGYGLFSTRQP